MDSFALGMPWNSDRPHIMVIACSDGRLQEATDEFLARALGIRHYDRLYMPGGAGALASTGGEALRAAQFRKECKFLVEAHQVEHLILLFHGPAVFGPAIATCADYLRKSPSASPELVRTQQAADTRDLLSRRDEFAGNARLAVYRLEVGATGLLTVMALHEDAPELADRLPAVERGQELPPHHRAGERREAPLDP